MLHTLYGRSLGFGANFFIEYFATDLIMNDVGQCVGVMAICMEDGTIHRFKVSTFLILTPPHAPEPITLHEMKLTNPCFEG